MKKATPIQIIYLIASVILIMIFVACNSEKRLARKESKAWDIYSTSPRLVQKSVPLVSALYPCINEIVRSDTNTIYLIDSFLVENKVPYNVYKDKTLDTLIDNISIFADSTGIALKYLGKKEKTIITIRDTVIDRKETNRLNDSLVFYKVKEAGLNGKYLQLEKHINEVLSDKTKWQTYFWILVALIGIALGGFLYIKFKIPLK